MIVSMWVHDPCEQRGDSGFKGGYQSESRNDLKRCGWIAEMSWSNVLGVLYLLSIHCRRMINVSMPPLFEVAKCP